MADFSQLGELLGSIGSSGDLAFNKGVETAANARYRSAQTEDALTNARVNQAEAVKAEAVNQQRAELEALRRAGGMDFTTPSEDMKARIMLGGLGDQVAHIGDFQLDAQQYRNRDTISNTDSSAVERLRAAQAVEGKPSADLVAVGSHGVVDLTKDNQELSVMAGLGGMDSQAGKQVQDRMALVRQFGEGSPQVVAFDNMLTKVVPNVGGSPFTWAPNVPPFTDAAAPGSSPLQQPVTVPTTPAPTTKAAPLVDQSTVASNIANNKQATAEGTALGNQVAGAGNKISAAEEMLGNIDALLVEPGFNTIYGASTWVDPRNYVPGTDASNAAVRRDQISNESFTNVMEYLRGLGAMSNLEGQSLKAAFQRATFKEQSEEAARVAFADLAEKLRVQIEKGRALQSRSIATPAATPGATPATGEPDFASMTTEQLQEYIRANGG